MDFGQPQPFAATPASNVELDQEFIEALETETVVLNRGEGTNLEQYPLYYVTNVIDLLNIRHNNLVYDPDTDIVKDVYEGGFKVWEGTYDLLEFLYQNGHELNLNGKKVLDVGCGCGLVGAFCLKAYDLGAVTFQDYNLDVLQFSTFPNLIKNGLEGQINRCKFISGDWSTTIEKVAQNTNELTTKLHTEPIEASKFDAILMSEVLYNPENYLKLATIINELLQDDGVCIISSKLYYFGVGGSVDEFKEFIQTNFAHLNIQTLGEINTKVSNKREIFAIRR